MRRILFTIVLVVIHTPILANAQTLVSRGVIGGYTVSEHAYDGDAPMENSQQLRAGFHIGGYVEWFDLPYLSLLIPIMYTEKGAEYKIQVVDEANPLGTGEFLIDDARLVYLSVGAYGKLSLPILTHALYTVAGPRIDFLLERDERSGFRDLYDKFRRVTYGGTIGGGVELNLLTGIKTFIEVRYNVDFNDSVEIRSDELNYTVRNESIDISLGLGY